MSRRRRGPQRQSASRQPKDADPSGLSDVTSVDNRLIGMAGVAIQAGVIHGDIKVGASSEFARFHAPGWTALPRLPERFLDRPEIAGRVRAELCVARSGLRPVVGLVGMAGAGKTMLARSVLTDPTIQARFPDGAVWLNVGPKPDLVSCLTRLAYALGDPQPVIDISEGHQRLARLMRTASVLVIADNVWSPEDTQSLVIDAAKCGLLVTTRNVDALSGGALVPVDTLTTEDARELLARLVGCPSNELPPESEIVVTKCGGLALALATTAGMVVEGRRWSSVVQRLDRADLDRLRHRFPDYPHPDLLTALDASVRALPDFHRNRFYEFAVFEGADRVPITAVAWLWRTTASMNDLDSEDLVIELGRLSLAEVDPASQTVILHDLLFDYVRTSLGADRVRHLRQTFAESYLKHWGGLDGKLCNLRLADDSDTAQTYGLTHLVSHLATSGEDGLVHSLLSLEWELSGTVGNAWFTIHERRGDTAAFLADIRLAWRLAEHATDTALADGKLAIAIALELRYMLITSSLISIADRIPASLLVSLVVKEIWLPQQALTYARTISDTCDRARTLAALLPYLPDVQRDHALTEALTAVSSVTSPGRQALALAALAPHLPDRKCRAVLTEALSTINALSNTGERFDALAVLAPHVPPEQRAAVLTELLAGIHADVLLQIRSPRRSSMEDLENLVQLLPARMIPVALAAAQKNSALHYKERFLATLAPRLSPTLLDEALSFARALKEPDAPICDDQADYEREVDFAAEHAAKTLTILVAYLPEEQRSPVLAEALTIAQTIGCADRRCAALAALVPHLADDQRPLVLSTTLAIALSLDQSAVRASSLVALVPYLADDQRHAVAAEAWNVARTVGGPGYAAEHLVALAPHLTKEQRNAAFTEALIKARHQDDILSDVNARLTVQKLAPHLHDGLLAEALTTALLISDQGQQYEALAALAPRLPPELLVEALATQRTIGDRRRQFKALARLASLLPLKWRGPAQAHALNLAHAFSDAYERVASLAELLPDLPPKQRKIVLASAIAAVHQSPSTQSLARLVRHLPRNLLTEALTIVSHMEMPADAMGFLAEHLPPALLAEAVTTAQAIRNPAERATALAWLIPRLPAKQRTPVLVEALTAARTADLPYARANALCHLLPHLSDEQRESALAVALTAARLIDPLKSQSWMLAQLASKVPADQRGLVLAEALIATRSTDDQSARAYTLGQLASLSPQEQRDAILTEALETAQSIDKPEERARELAHLASRFPEDQERSILNEALAVTRTIDDPQVLASTLTTLGSRLPLDLVPDAVATARTISSPRWQIDALTYLLRWAERNHQTYRDVGAVRWRHRWRHVVLAATGAGRESALEVVWASASAALASGGSDTIKATAVATIDVSRWWP
jgi:hypothetical protein